MRSPATFSAKTLIPPLLLDVARMGRLILRSPAYGRAIRQNRAWQGRYKGRRVYVLGNGPSLQHLDPNLLEGTDVIVMNSFERCEWKEQVNIVAHCLGEPRSSTAWSEEETRASIEGTRSESYWLHFSSRPAFRSLEGARSLAYVFPVVEPLLWPKRPVALHHPTMGYQTTAQLAIQVALYLGYRDIGLLGFDHDWLAHPDYSRHFYSATRDPNDILRDLTYLELVGLIQRMWTIYYALDRAANAQGVSIVNLTPSSHLDVFVRGTVEEWIGASR